MNSTKKIIFLDYKGDEIPEEYNKLANELYDSNFSLSVKPKVDHKNRYTLCVTYGFSFKDSPQGFLFWSEVCAGKRPEIEKTNITDFFNYNFY